MSEFKVGDRVITRWDDLAYSRFNLPYDAVPDGEHTITEIVGDACRLAGYPNWWYPLDNMTKVDNAPAVKDDDSIFRDECAMRAMQADWSSNGVADPAFKPECTDETLAKWAALYYRMADAMLEARKK
jgi:hypothetical protein